MKQLIYKYRPGYDSRNRCSFNRFLKVSRDGAEVTSAGRSFHTRAPATGKARCPTEFVMDSVSGWRHSFPRRVQVLTLKTLNSWCHLPHSTESSETTAYEVTKKYKDTYTRRKNDALERWKVVPALADLVENCRIAVQQWSVGNVRVADDPAQIWRRKPRLRHTHNTSRCPFNSTWHSSLQPALIMYQITDILVGLFSFRWNNACYLTYAYNILISYLRYFVFVFVFVCLFCLSYTS